MIAQFKFEVGHQAFDRGNFIVHFAAFCHIVRNLATIWNYPNTGVHFTMLCYNVSMSAGCTMSKPFRWQANLLLSPIFRNWDACFQLLHVCSIARKDGKMAKMGIDFRHKKHAMCDVCKFRVAFHFFFTSGNALILQPPPPTPWAIKASYVKQYASVLFLAPEFIGLLMDLNVPNGGFRHLSEFMTCRGAAYTAAIGLTFPRPIPSHDRFTDTWKELMKLLALDRRVSVAHPPTSGRSWPLQSWARYIQSRALLVDTIDWKRPLTFLVRGMTTRAPVEVGPNFPLGSSTAAHGNEHPPTCGRLASPYARIRSWPRSRQYAQRTFGSTVVLFCFHFRVNFLRLILNVSQKLTSTGKLM